MTDRIRAMGLLVAPLLALVGLPSAAQGEGLTLAPEQPEVAAGQSIAFVGAGFTPNERVVTWATAPDQAVIAGSYADAKGADGRIEFSFHVPKDAIGGRWSMTAFGRDSK